MPPVWKRTSASASTDTDMGEKSPPWLTVTDAPSTSVSFENDVEPLMWLSNVPPETPGVIMYANDSACRPPEKLSGRVVSDLDARLVPICGVSV